jgi:hypothetical protein
MRINRLTFLITCLSLTSLSWANTIAPTEQAAVRHGIYAGIQFGYLDNDYGDDINLYVPGEQEVTPEGSRFAFTASVGYNYNQWFGEEIGGLFFSDKGQSQATDPSESAHAQVTAVNVLALIHLKLDDSLSWVGTIKPGFAVMFAHFGYDFSSSSQSPPWQNAPNQANFDKTVLVPTIGISFQHSYNKHWAMNFSYQYYYADYAKFNDPYQTPVSSLAYLNLGWSYTF